ncbi:small basic protein [Candidatus Omnitrophota bacterium]
MSQHPSLKSSKSGKKLRTVLKRYERFFTLKEKGRLKDDSSVFGMPKLKVVRAKIKKEKAEEKPEEVQAAAAPAETAGAPKQATAKTEKEKKPKK